VLNSLVDLFCQEALRSWPVWFPGQMPPELVPVVLAGGPVHRHGRAIVFLLRRQDGQPQVVVKVGFTKAEGLNLVREYNALTELRQIVPREMSDQIPKPLEVVNDGEHAYVALTALSGRRLLVPELTHGASRHARRLTLRFVRETLSWTRGLAAVTQGEPMSQSERLTELTEDFEDSYKPESRARQRLVGFRKALAASRIVEPRAWQHGDLGMGNVLNHRGKLNFLDWEHARPMEPWFDVAWAPLALAALGGGMMDMSKKEAAPIVLGSNGWVGQMLEREIRQVWTYSLPIQWAFVLAAIQAAMRHVGQESTTTGRDWAALATSILTDRRYRQSLSWLAPEW